MDEMKKELDALRELILSSAYLKRNTWAKRNKGQWSKLWGAFDNIEDTIKATCQFLTAKDVGTLGLYGILQALTVQQDAVKHLEEALGLAPTKLEDDAGMTRIRNIRDETTGHPTSTMRAGEKSSYKSGTITYTSISPNISDKNLEYVVWSKDGTVIEKVNLVEIIHQQDKRLAGILADIRKSLTEGEVQHKEKFKNDSLEQLFAQSGYHIQKLWPFERSREYSAINLKMLRESYNRFKNGIKARYGHEVLKDYGFLPGIVLVTDKLDKIFPRIEDRILMNEGVDELELEVYIESLESAINELKDMAREVDEKFGYEPAADSDGASDDS